MNTIIIIPNVDKIESDDEIASDYIITTDGETDGSRTKGVFINKVLFKILLDNVLTNANKYGFDKNSEENHVEIEAYETEEHLTVIIRNNGKPFPKNFDREKFITKYSTADNSNGSGLGGYDIDRIARYFKNENWERRSST